MVYPEQALKLLLATKISTFPCISTPHDHGGPGTNHQKFSPLVAWWSSSARVRCRQLLAAPAGIEVAITNNLGNYGNDPKLASNHISARWNCTFT